MKSTLKKLGKSSLRFLKRNLPTIVTAFGIGGTIAAGYFYTKAKEDYDEYIQEEYDEAPIGTEIEITRTTKFKAFVDAYTLPILMHTASIVCIIAGDRLHVGRQIKLSEAYMALDASYKAYRLKSNEIYGDDASEKIDFEIAKDKMRENMDWKYGNDLVTFYDGWNDRYFEATMEDVQEAIAALNNHYCRYGYAYLNTFYACIPNLESPALTRDLGWTTANIKDYIPWDIKHVIIHDNEVYDYYPESNGLECYYISPLVAPEFIDLFYTK